MMRVGVLGAAGRMGTTICRAVDGDQRFELVAAVDPHAAGQSLRSVVGDIDTELSIISTLEAAPALDAVVDFTVATSAVANLTYAANNGIHVVCGTTGISPDDLDVLRSLFARDDGPNCIIAPNFAISAVLMMRFSEIAAKYFDGVEIIELHHNEKRDAPSGTALETARRITAARGDTPFSADPTTDEVRQGARGGVDGEIHVHSVRLPGLIAHQEVLFGSTGQLLRIQQDSFDRNSFGPGVLLALSKVATTSGLTIGLDQLLD